MNNNLLIISGEEKGKHTTDSFIINNDNVYLTYANVVKLNSNIYCVDGDDGSLIKSYAEVIQAITNGDDVIINLNYKDYIVCAIIPKSLETKLKNAIIDENYELAELIKKQMNNG